MRSLVYLTILLIPSKFQTPFLWSHGMTDKVVFVEAGQAGPPFLQSSGANCEFKVDFYNAPFSITSKDLQCLFEL